MRLALISIHTVVIRIVDDNILQEGLASSFDPSRRIYFLYQGVTWILIYLLVTLKIMVYLCFYYVLRKKLCVILSIVIF